MKFTFVVEGVAALKRQLERIGDAIVTGSSKSVEAGCRRVVRRAKAAAPVGETGNLRDSITYAMRGKTLGVVGLELPGAAYWYFVEYGTVHAAAHPFMRPAIEAEQGTFVGDMEMVVRGAIDTEA